jgi:hypothetical protein
MSNHQNNASGSSGGKKFGGRGAQNNRRFVLRPNQNQEKGLIDGLPMLKYSSRIEDQMPVNFINWKEKLFQYVQNSGNYSPNVAKVLKGEDVQPEAIPNPPRPGPAAAQQPPAVGGGGVITRGQAQAQAQALAQRPARADEDVVEWWEKEEWKDDCKRVKDRNEKLGVDKKKLFALMLGQSAENIKQKLLAQQDWIEVSQYENPLELLRLLNRVCMTPGSYSQEERMHAARTSYHTLKQWKSESLGDFRKRFDAAVETLKQCGVDNAQLPSDAIQAVDYANALDKSRFGQFLVDYRNGLLPGLDSVDKIQVRAECYVTLQSQQADKPAQIFLCSETRKPAANSNKHNKKKNNDGRNPNTTNKNDNDGGSKRKGNSKRPSADNRCYTCGSTDHFARDCPDGKDSGEQQKFAPATNLVSLASIVIPHDTLDNDDPMEITADDDVSLVESTALLSITDAEKVKVKSDIMVGAESLPSHFILLDTCGSANIFCNPNLLLNIRSASYGLIIEGISKSSKPVITYHEGDTCFGPSHYSPDARGNVLSFAMTHDRCSHMHYDFNQDCHFIRMEKDGPFYVFVRWNNIYVHDTTNEAHTSYENVCMSFNVKEKMAKYTKREVRDAAAARDLMRRLADPSPSSVAERLRSGRIAHTTLVPEDIWRSMDIWGKTHETIKGKTTSHKAPVVKPQRIPVKELQQNQELQVDLMFVDRVAFLLGVLVPMKYILLSPLVNKTKDVIWKSLKKFIAIPKSRNIIVDVVRTDPESAIMALETEVAEAGCQLNPGGRGEAVPVVERTIRTIKERCRGIINTLAYTLPYCLIAALCVFVVQRLNMFPSSTANTVYSPREQMWNRVINAKTDLALGFGDYVQAHRNVEDNTMNPRTDGVIALYPLGNLEGTWAFFNLNTNRVIKRNRWTEVPLDQRVIEYMNDMSLNQKRKLPRDISFYRGESLIDDDDDDEREVVNVEDDDNVPDLTPVMIHRAEDIVEDIPAEYDINDVIQPEVHQVTNQLSVEDVQQPAQEIVEAAPTITPPEVIVRDEIFTTQDQPRYDLRPNRAGLGRWNNLLADSKRVYGLHYSTRAAIKKFGSKAFEVMMKEMSQIIEKETIRPVTFNKIEPRLKKKIIRSHMFFKEKFHPNGDFDKLKARFVAGGDGQDRSVYSESEITSQTVSTSSVFIIAAIAARESRAVATVDFPGAYLNSDMPTDGEPVHMSLDPYMTGVLTKLKPDYRKYVNQNGTCVVRVVKGLYGLIEAAKLWFDKLSSLLKSLGFTQNPYDPCVMNRTNSDGKQTTLAIHVDDVLITAPSEGAVTSLLSELESHYPGLSISRGRELNYLGMVFKFTDDKKCTISMDGFVNDLLSNCDISGTSNTPATSSLFSIDEKSKALSTDKKKLFHSITAKLLYYSKRIRPDLLVAVSFLTTRVQNPTEEDWTKLCRAIKYIRHTKGLCLVLCAHNYLTIIVYVDASFGVHPDFRSHSGAVITLFRGTIWAKSSKQKLMTKSSTEAELVAISDVIGQVLWMRNFLEAQGYILPPVKMFEDNLSTIALIKNGKSNSSRTRHIAIRYFFIADKVSNKEIEIEYKATEEMLADILTKPLQGQLFKRLRDQLLNT